MPESASDPRLRSLINQLRPGPVRTVKVIGFDTSDVLVTLADDGGAEAEIGRIPLHEASMRRLEHPSEIFEVGQRITAEVIAAETRTGQVTVSLKALQEDPLVRFADRAGRVVTGPITKIIPFGLFVQLAPDVEGFLHVSELTDEPVESPEQLVGEGELITVKVAEVDLRRHRVRLSVADRAGSG